MAEKRVFKEPFLFPENIHYRYGIVKHPQGNIFRGDGGKDRGLGLTAIDERKGTDVVQVGIASNS